MILPTIFRTILSVPIFSIPFYSIGPTILSVYHFSLLYYPYHFVLEPLSWNPVNCVQCPSRCFNHRSLDNVSWCYGQKRCALPISYYHANTATPFIRKQTIVTSYVCRNH